MSVAWVRKPCGGSSYVDVRRIDTVAVSGLIGSGCND